LKQLEQLVVFLRCQELLAVVLEVEGHVSALAGVGVELEMQAELEPLIVGLGAEVGLELEFGLGLGVDAEILSNAVDLI
jgi:hypothetical protein